MNIETKQLLNKISQTKDIRRFIEQYEEEFLRISPIEYLKEILAQKNMTPSEVAKRSGQGEYVYKVFRGERKPSRDVLIAIGIGMQLTVDEVQLLLRSARCAQLDPRDKRDSIILYSLKEKQTIEQLNDLLYELQQPTL